MDDLQILARTLFGEARGEGDEGIEAVACVVMNRYQAKKWFTGYEVKNGKKIPSIAQTCLKKAQFSCWNKNDANYKLLIQPDLQAYGFKKCLKIAEKALSGGLIDFTNGALFYHTRQVKPVWAKNKAPCYVTGNHLFYNDIE
ncbi:MAG: cell wall hydrolase [Pseudomonadota bacterium]|nr:cell wall hydrolase [Pseudomonadota bacterium]